MDGETPKVEAATAETEQVAVQDVAAVEAAAPVDPALEAARREAIAERKKRQQFEARLAEIEKAQMGETERAKAEAAEAQKRAEAAEAQLKALKLRSVVTERAAAKGVIDPDAAFRLLEVDFDVDAEDLKAQADKALDALIAERKYLVAPPAAPATSPANGQTRTGTKLTMEDLRQMTREQISALPKEEVDAVLRGN